MSCGRGGRERDTWLGGRVDPLHSHNVTGVQSRTLAGTSVLKAWTSPLQSLVYKYLGQNRGATYLYSSTPSKRNKMRKDSQEGKLGEPTSENVTPAEGTGLRRVLEPGHRCSSLIVFAGCICDWAPAPALPYRDQLTLNVPPPCFRHSVSSLTNGLMISSLLSPQKEMRKSEVGLEMCCQLYNSEHVTMGNHKLPLNNLQVSFKM